MIFYFSGTGNSEWVAQELGNQLGMETASIVDITRAGGGPLCFGAGDTVGLVFPVYAGSAPEIVLEFVKSISADGAYIFAVCTCAGSAGNAVKGLARKIRIDSGFSVIMPNNFVMGANVESPEKIAAKIAAARERLPHICEKLAAKQSCFETTAPAVPLFITDLAAWGFNLFARITKPFSVGEGCVGCGMCEKLCSAGTIVMENGKPKWGKHCYMCMSCINRCPQNAIQYGEATKKRGRYCFDPDKI